MKGSEGQMQLLWTGQEAEQAERRKRGEEAKEGYHISRRRWEAGRQDG